MAERFYTGTFEFRRDRGFLRRPETSSRTLIFFGVHPALFEGPAPGQGVRRSLVRHGEISCAEAEGLRAAYVAMGRHDDLYDASRLREVARLAPGGTLAEMLDDHDVGAAVDSAAAAVLPEPEAGPRYALV